MSNSTICRLCAEKDENGEALFTSDLEETELCQTLNRYLPVKIHFDKELPQTICSGCNIQLEATIQFLKLIIIGQSKIKTDFKKQRDLRNYQEEACLYDDYTTETEKINETPESNNILPVELGHLKIGHEINLQVQLEKPKKRKGRPPKILQERNYMSGESCKISQTDSVKKEKSLQHSISNEHIYENEDEDITNNDEKRKKRKIQTPKRFMETLQGKELEKIFKSKGVLKNEMCIKKEYFDEQISDNDDGNEVIGHLESLDGENLGELVYVNKNKNNKIEIDKNLQKDIFVCKYCKKSFLQRSKYIIHQSSHEAKFTCTACFLFFSNKKDLLCHLEDSGHMEKNVKLLSKNTILNSTNEKMTMSVDANKQINSKQLHSLAFQKNDIVDDSPKNIDVQVVVKDELNELCELEATDNKEDEFKCNQCEKHYDTTDKLEMHKKIVHNGEKPFICNVCDKPFSYESTLKDHMEIAHLGKKSAEGFPCDICGKVLNHPSSIIYHKTTEHNNGCRYVCNKCGKNFKHKQLLQRHQLVHSEDRPFACNLCNNSFKTKANLLNHQSTHTGEKKHCCDICGQQFAHKTSLTLHYRWHTGQKPYKCDVCSKSFSQNGNLQEHMRIHTGEKPYCCDYCGRKFTTSSQFKLHIKRHTGERPWKCEFCSKSFLHKDTWKCHVRRHKGERPFQCKECNRGFTEQWALKKHLRLHTGEKPYICNICSKPFADCSNLAKHKKVHNNHKNIEGSELTSKNNNSRQISPSLVNNLNDSIENIDQEDTDISQVPQIIYITYTDSESNHQFYSEQINTSDEHSDEKFNESEEILENLDEDMQIQITDQDGNVLPISLNQAKQLLSGGHFLNEGLYSQNMSLESSDTNNLELNVDSRLQKHYLNSESISKVGGIFQSNAENNFENNFSLDNEQKTLELVTHDGQKVRLITSLQIDPLQVNSEFMTVT